MPVGRKKRNCVLEEIMHIQLHAILKYRRLANACERAQRAGRGHEVCI